MTESDFASFSCLIGLKAALYPGDLINISGIESLVDDMANDPSAADDVLLLIASLFHDKN